ncbi:MAG: hypothetical protein RLZZ436_986 [Planctomycetota bacterium]|jgi:hypothetical protein
MSSGCSVFTRQIQVRWSLGGNLRVGSLVSAGLDLFLILVAPPIGLFSVAAPMTEDFNGQARIPSGGSGRVQQHSG